MDEVREDSYRELAKMPTAARCPQCGAAYLTGQWSWNPAPPGASMHTCPACQRIHDERPVHEAFKGTLEMTFGPGENLLRASWKR